MRHPSRGPGGVARQHPFVPVADAQAAFDAALEAGAEPIAQPTRVMEGVTTAVVRAPGGVIIGFSGP